LFNIKYLDFHLHLHHFNASNASLQNYIPSKLLFSHNVAVSLRNILQSHSTLCNIFHSHMRLSSRNQSFIYREGRRSPEQKAEEEQTASSLIILKSIYSVELTNTKQQAKKQAKHVLFAVNCSTTEHSIGRVLLCPSLKDVFGHELRKI
jgi:hypothetical protein